MPKMIRRCIWIILRFEFPAVIEHQRADDGDADHVLKVFQGSKNQRAVRQGQASDT